MMLFPTPSSPKMTMFFFWLINSLTRAHSVSLPMRILSSPPIASFIGSIRKADKRLFARRCFPAPRVHTGRTSCACARTRAAPIPKSEDGQSALQLSQTRPSGYPQDELLRQSDGDIGPKTADRFVCQRNLLQPLE